MNKSLNQAFIKAYSKEQASLAKQQVAGASSDHHLDNFKVEDYIVRFDTATCVIPTHHAAPSQKPKVAAANAVSRPRPTPGLNSLISNHSVSNHSVSNHSVSSPELSPRTSAPTQADLSPSAESALRQTVNSSLLTTTGATVLNLSRRGRGQVKQSRTVVSHREQELVAERHVAEQLRSTIASQMSRAGNWEAQQIDAFGGGFPMVSPYHQRRGPLNPEPTRLEQTQPEPTRPALKQPVQPSTAAPQSQLNGPHFGRAEPREMAAASSFPAVPAAGQQARRQPPAHDDGSRDRVRLREDAEPRADLPAANPFQISASLNNSARDDGRDGARDGSIERGRSNDQAPRMSPLESPALTRSDIRAQQAALAAQLSRGARVEEQAAPGEIFRLDRPTYNPPADRAAGNEYADSGDLSSEVLGLSASGTNVDIEALVSHRSESTRQVADTKVRVDAADRSRGVGQEIANESMSPKVTAKTTKTTTASAASATASETASAVTPATAANAKAASKTTASKTSAETRDWPAKSLERDLRKAKVRIFNPVWEVDNFQWPEICLELLEQRADALDTVARNLIEACQDGLQVLAVTSPHSGEGRTTVACCLAKLAGSRGLNVAIVDGDIENPTLSFQTNLELEQDWKTAIFNQLPLEEVAVHSIADQVTLVPLVQPIEHDEMATDDNRIEFMLQELSASFDLVIVDMGHMDSSRSLVTSLGERGVISAVVAVVDYRSSTRQQVDNCLRRIRQTGVASIGLVENFAA